MNTYMCVKLYIQLVDRSKREKLKLLMILSQ